MAGMPPPPPRASSPSREHPGASSSPSSSSSFAPRPTDAAVRLTNDEASVAKARCHELGYFDDPLAAAFAPRGPAKRGGGGTHHEPLINRGYYARVRAMRAMIDAFMDASLPGDDDEDDDRDVRDDRVRRRHHPSRRRRQIVSLGAGFDTSYFRLLAAGRAPGLFVEVDYGEVARKKAEIVRARRERFFGDREDEMTNALVNLADGSYHGDGGGGDDDDPSFRDVFGYRLLSADLRDVATLERKLLDLPGYDAEIPTLFLAECCLAYVEPEEAAAVIALAARLSSSAPAAAFVLYDPIGPDDAFGVQMGLNLRARGCPLRGVAGAPTLEAQRERFQARGWARAGAMDMNDACDRLARRDASDHLRMTRLEMLDEVEEFRMMLAHYCVAWGVNEKKRASNGGGALFDALSGL